MKKFWPWLSTLGLVLLAGGVFYFWKMQQGLPPKGDVVGWNELEAQGTKLLPEHVVQIKKEIAANAFQPAGLETRVVIGDPESPITIVAYIDLGCKHCKRAFYAFNLLAKDMYKGKVKVVIKHLPASYLTPALYLEALAQVDHKLALQFVSQMFAEQEAFLVESDKPFGAKAFMKKIISPLHDFEKIDALAQSDKIMNILDQDEAEARAMGFTATPTIVVGGARLIGGFSISAYKAVIDMLLD